MKKLDCYISEKLKIDKDSDPTKEWSSFEKEVNHMFSKPEAKETLKFVLNLIKRGKREPYANSIIAYWEMGINGKYLTCQHCGYSHSRSGWGKVSYIETCVKNYNKDHGTDIDTRIAGAMADSGICIFNIKKVMDLLKWKYPDFKITDREGKDITDTFELIDVEI